MAREEVLQALLQRGVPQHIAQGILGNISVESKFNPGINEINPTVPGSRGGFGLFQHTGPRRRELEAFAKSTGRPLADIGTQVDFALQELGTTERKAGQALSQATTAEEAARIFSEQFLRPGTPHLDRRIAAATGITGGGGDDTLQGGLSITPQRGQGFVPQQQQQRRGLGGLLGGGGDRPGFLQEGGLLGPDRRDRLVAGLEGLTLNPNRALQQSALQSIDARAQRRTTTEQANKTAEFLRSRGRDDLAGGVESGAITAQAAVQAALAAPKDDRTSLIKNYEFAKGQGFDGSIVDFQTQTRPGQSITVNTGAETSKFGDAPKGTVWALDENGEHIMETAPGSDRQRPVTLPLEGSAAEGRAIDVAATGTAGQEAVAKATDSLALIDSIIKDPALPKITGMIQGNLPPLTQAGTDLNVKVKQLQGQAFLQAFESLKGGGSITEREGQAAQAAMARLDRAQSTEAYVKALNELKGILKRGIERGQGGPATGAGDGEFVIRGRVD